ncbi:MAG: hypothetical protein NC082_03510 [Clostridiales bacterium]|nr:hypothetical protein [Clostridiales bacterium]
MNNLLDILRSLIAMIALIVIMVLSPACSDSDAELPDVTVGPRQLGFTLTIADTPEKKEVSRATPADGTYDPGSGYENYIDIPGKDFRFYFFTSDDKFIGEIKITSLIPVSVNPLNSSKTYEVLGSLDAEIGSYSTFKVCVLANWNSYPTLNEGDNLSLLWEKADSNVYTYNIDPLSTEHTIPLYGIRQFDNVTLVPNEFTALGRIHLLRAYAKVEVILDPTVTLYDVKSVSLTRVNTQGYKAPNGISLESQYVHDQYDRDYVDTPHIPASVGIRQDIPMTLISDIDYTMRYISYVPEYDNRSQDVEKCRVKIEYDNEMATTDYIDFKYYQATGTHQAGEVFDLLRNNWYRFKASKFLESSTPQVEVDVIPYAVRDLSPIFGLDPEFPMPEKLYIVGELYGEGFSPDKGYELIRDPQTNIYEGDVEITGEFWFALGLNTELEPERFYSHGNQFGPRVATKISYNNTVFITLMDDPAHIGLSDNTPNAYYKVMVDWPNMEVRLLPASEPDNP